VGDHLQDAAALSICSMDEPVIAAAAVAAVGATAAIR
jgi:hypothetical protein